MAAEIAYAQNIRPLFRERDVKSMSFAFDLSSYDDVRDERRGDLRETRRRNNAVRRSVADRECRALPHVDGQRVAAVGLNPPLP